MNEIQKVDLYEILGEEYFKPNKSNDEIAIGFDEEAMNLADRIAKTAPFTEKSESDIKAFLYENIKDLSDEALKGNFSDGSIFNALYIKCYFKIIDNMRNIGSINLDLVKLFNYADNVLHKLWEQYLNDIYNGKTVGIFTKYASRKCMASLTREIKKAVDLEKKKIFTPEQLAAQKALELINKEKWANYNKPNQCIDYEEISKKTNLPVEQLKLLETK